MRAFRNRRETIHVGPKLYAGTGYSDPAQQNPDSDGRHSYYSSMLYGYPTVIFDGTEVASPEKKDGGSNAAEFPDWQKSYVAQSISRLESMNNQEVKITIPLHPELKVGQTVEIFIPNMIPVPDRTTDEYDPEHSGVYLIAKLNHAYDFKNIKGNTHLTLIRDSYGRRDGESKSETV